MGRYLLRQPQVKLKGEGWWPRKAQLKQRNSWVPDGQSSGSKL